jgi:hypothetical protein
MLQFITRIAHQQRGEEEMATGKRKMEFKTAEEDVYIELWIDYYYDRDECKCCGVFIEGEATLEPGEAQKICNLNPTLYWENLALVQAQAYDITEEQLHKWATEDFIEAKADYEDYKYHEYKERRLGL